MIFKKSIFLLTFLLAACLLFAQDKPQIAVSVDKNRILLGETFRLQVLVRFPSGTPGQFVRIDSIPHFEMVEPPVIDSSVGAGERKINGIYLLTSFDSGHWVIPSFSLSPTLRSDTIGIDVVFADFNPEQEYHDIKDIIEVKVDRKIPWWWYAAGGGLVLALLLVYLLRKKKPTLPEQQRSSLTAFEEAMKQLDQLKKERPASKQFHTRLGEIFRLYVFKKKGLLSLQKTTDDLVVQLKSLDMEKSQYDKLIQALRLGDLVKFAKYNTTAGDDDQCFNDIGNSIVHLEKKGAPTSTDTGS